MLCTLCRMRIDGVAVVGHGVHGMCHAVASHRVHRRGGVQGSPYRSKEEANDDESVEHACSVERQCPVQQLVLAVCPAELYTVAAVTSGASSCVIVFFF